MGGTQARIQDFLKGGGVKTFTSTPLPLDIVRVTSSVLQKIKKHPHSWTFTSTPPPLDIARVTSSTFQGGGVIGPGHAHFPWHRFSVSGQVQGGVIIPVTHTPLDPPLEHYIYRVWLGCLYHGRNKESSSNRRGWLISHSGAYFHL